MTVRIIASKTDQYRQGDSIMVARTDTSTCPVAMMEKYYVSASLSHSSSLPLFRGITRTKNGERLRSAGGLSYTRMRELFLAKLRELGFEASQFGLHSLRAVVPPQWLMPECRTGFLNAMAVGDQRLQKTATLKTRSRHSCPSQGA